MFSNFAIINAKKIILKDLIMLSNSLGYFPRQF